MQKFFDFLKKKKVFISALLLFFVISGIIIPQVTLAVTAGQIAECIIPVLCIGNGIYNWWTGSSGSATGKIFGGVASQAASDLLVAVVKGITNFFIGATQSIANWAGSLFASIFSTILNWNITSDADYITGWTAVRDLANMLIVLGFVVVGISFALRFGEYGSKKVLINLVIVALLINFSGLFCGLIIDASNITMNYFVGGATLSGGSGTGGGGANAQIAQTNILPAIEAYNNMAFGPESDVGNDPAKYVLAAATIILMYVIVFIVFGYMIIVMFERYIMLAILYIVSPLAFFAWIFPKTKKYWSKWWEDFLKYSIIGAEAGFFLWIVGKLLSTPDALTIVTPYPDGTQTRSADMLHLCVALAFLYIGFKLIKKSSALADSVISYAKSAAGLVAAGGMAIASGGTSLAGSALAGTVGKLPGGGGQNLAQRTSSIKQSISGSVGRTMERLNLRQTGSTAATENSRVSAEQKSLDTALTSGNASDKARVYALARNGTGARGAAAMAAVVNAGQIGEAFKGSDGKPMMSQIEQRMRYAGSFGTGNLADKASKENPYFARFDEAKVTKKIADSGVDSNGLRVAPMSREAAQNAVMTDAVKKMSPEDFGKNVSVSAYDSNLVSKMTTAQVTKGVYGRFGSQAKQDAFKKGLEGLKNGNDNEKQKYKELSKAMTDEGIGGSTASTVTPPPVIINPPPTGKSPTTTRQQYNASAGQVNQYNAPTPPPPPKQKTANDDLDLAPLPASDDRGTRTGRAHSNTIKSAPPPANTPPSLKSKPRKKPGTDPYEEKID